MPTGLLLPTLSLTWYSSHHCVLDLMCDRLIASARFFFYDCGWTQSLIHIWQVAVSLGYISSPGEGPSCCWGIKSNVSAHGLLCSFCFLWFLDSNTGHIICYEYLKQLPMRQKETYFFTPKGWKLERFSHLYICYLMISNDREPD